MPSLRGHPQGKPPSKLSLDWCSHKSEIYHGKKQKRGSQKPRVRVHRGILLQGVKGAAGRQATSSRRRASPLDKKEKPSVQHLDSSTFSPGHPLFLEAFLNLSGALICCSPPKLSSPVQAKDKKTQREKDTWRKINTV